MGPSMAKKMNLRELAKALSCEMRGDPEWIIEGVNDLKNATPHDVSFFANEAYRKDFESSQAGAICVKEENGLAKDRNYLIGKHPAALFQALIELLCHDASVSGFKGIHPTAVIHETVSIGQNVSVGPHAVIDRDVIIGDETIISPHVSIGPEVKIGNNCLLHPHVVVREACILGNRVILQPGVVIGGCGYGYVQNERNESIKLSHRGNVVLEDDVEVGANTTIDRGHFKSTRVKKGAKIDNLVMLAHNTEIGQNTLVIAQAGIAGSTVVGNNCIIAAQAGIVGHLKIADQVIIGAQSGVGKSIKEKGFYGSGWTIVPIEEYRRRVAHVNRLDKYVEQIKALQKRITTLEKEISCQLPNS